MDDMILDAEILRSTADILSSYMIKQRETVLNYMRKIMELSNEWKDDETFTALFQAVAEIQSKVSAMMDSISPYVAYFRDKAAQIESRPIFNKDSSSDFKSSSTPTTAASGSISSSSGTASTN